MLFPVLFLITLRVWLASAQLATVYSNCNEPNTVALTFDDGPYNYMQYLSPRLRDHGVKATFFVNGNNWRCIYDNDMVEALKTAYDDGHEFGSHTWRHHNLNDLGLDGPGGLYDEMWRTEAALERILGVSPALLRPPFGSYNDQVRRAAYLRNQSLVLWDMAPGDSAHLPVDVQQQAYTDIANQRPSNILTLNHETYSSTVTSVIPHAIFVLQSKGYRFATVSECLGIQPYKWTGAPGTRADDWNCNA